MTSTQAIMVLIIRLWAAQIIIQWILTVPFQAFLVGSSDSSAQNYLIALTSEAALWVIIGLAAWVFSLRIAQLFPIKGQNVETLKVSAEDLVAIGSFLIGAFLLVLYGSELLATLVRWAVFMATGESATDMFRTTTVNGEFQLPRNFLNVCLVFVVALFMTFRPSGLARIFTPMRSAGLSKADLKSSQ